MSFLFGSTPQFKQVEAATSDMLIGPDWAANMELWDCINRSPDGGREYLKAIEKRMGHKKAHVVDLALDLLGSCVKNCGGMFHRQVHQQGFLNSMVRVTKRAGAGGNEQAVREKALVMIMAWAEAFQRVRGLPNFSTTYEKLREAGVQFPARDMSEMAPVFTPERSVEQQQQQQQEEEQSAVQQRPPPEAFHPFSSVTPAYVDKVKNELRQVMGYVNIVRDMLMAAESAERAAREDSLQQLVATLREVQSRLIRILVEIDDGALVDVLVGVNEHVGVVLQWHHAVLEGHEFTDPELPAPAGLEPAPLDEAAAPVAERKADDGGEDAPAQERSQQDRDFDELAAASPAADAAAAGSAPAHRKTPSQELEELLGLSGGGGGAGDNAGEVDVSAQEFEDLLGLTDPGAGAADAQPAKSDPAILDDL